MKIEESGDSRDSCKLNIDNVRYEAIADSWFVKQADTDNTLGMKNWHPVTILYEKKDNGLEDSSKIALLNLKSRWPCCQKQ